MEELYTLEREVGRGSYGVVFEGHVAKTGQKVAIKRLPCRNPECIELYLQELWAMRATAKNHPNVIALHCCLVQTGPRTLQPLKPGKLPLDLVESSLKGSVIGVVQTQERPNSRSSLDHSVHSLSPRPKLQHRTNTGHLRPKLLDKTNSAVSNTATPRRPESRRRRRPARREDEEGTGRPGRCRALWLVMEFCDGGDLNQYLLSKPPDSQRNHSVILQLSSAVAFLHSHGIIHRDLKPDNVLVCVTRKGPVVKVADFGLSKVSEGLVEGDLTRQHFSSTCGSDFYMAPEVWGGLTYTAQADIFSLGVLFWAVLERITILEEGAIEEQLGAYVCKGRSSWLMPLGEALWENPNLQLCIPLRCRRATPFPPPPGPATCRLLLDMLASDPHTRPPADELEARVRTALKEDSDWQKGIVEAP